MITDFLTSYNLEKAQKEVLAACENGKAVTLIKPEIKDEFGEVLEGESLLLKSFPIRFSPYSKDIREKISWTEEVDVICYIPKMSLDIASITINNLQRYRHLMLDGKQYDIKHINCHLNFGDDFLYYIIGAIAKKHSPVITEVVKDTG